MAVDTVMNNAWRREVGGGRRYRYCVYGVVVVSDIPLALPEYSHGSLGYVELIDAPASVFLTALEEIDFDSRSDSWHRYASLHDGSTYVRWNKVGEFLVASDGRRIACRRFEDASSVSFQVYLLGQALSFALVKQGVEPLHATAVVVGDQAVAFLGNNAFGKSTLAASFVEAGHRLLTDDLLVLEERFDRVLAYPGPPRIKLFPRIASRFVGHPVDPVTLNTDTDKLILPLDERRVCAHPVALKHIYSLVIPRDACRRPDVSIETLSPREAFVESVRGTFNRRLVSPLRLERQFNVMAKLTELIPVKTLSYPRTIARLEDVRRIVLADLGHAVERGAFTTNRKSVANRARTWPFPSQSA